MKLQTGDKVYDITYGHGTVTSARECFQHVMVRWDNGGYSYMPTDAKYMSKVA